MKKIRPYCPLLCMLSVYVWVCLSSYAATESSALSRFATASFYADAHGPRTVYNFNTGWRFIKQDVQGAELSDFDDSTWEYAVVPHGLEILPENASGGRNYQGIAWYRKQFKVHDGDGSKRHYLYFEAVMGKAKVWVNGKQVAEHFGGYLPFAADVTDVIYTDGRSNVLAVMADNSDDPNYLPGKHQDGLDFSYLGGIYRDVYMIVCNDVHVSLPELSDRVAGGGVFVATLEAKDAEAKVVIRTEVNNSLKQSQRIIVRTTLEDMNCVPIKSVRTARIVGAQSSVEYEQFIAATNVHLWHPDDPYLHYVKTEVEMGGVVVDAFRTRFGIRTIDMKGPKGLYVNGEPLNKPLVGANRHQDYVYVGNALPNSGQWRDVKLLREGGCNIIRVGHYPQDDAFYDACDELGMFATTANPGWHFFNFKNPVFEERLYADTRNLVRKDRNHACILMWETALNETPEQPSYAMNTMHHLAHEEYPFPGMYTVTDYAEAKKAGLDMYYHGTDTLINSFVRECGDGGEVDNWYSHNAVTRVKMEWGERALLGQAEKLSQTLNMLYGSEGVRLGGALWAGIEHQRGYHPDPFWGGLLNVYRMPKYSYYLWKSQYAPDLRVKGIETGPMIHIVHELTQLSPSDITLYSNCEEVRLTYDGRLIGTQGPSTAAKYSHLPHPPFVFEDAFALHDIKVPGRHHAFEAEMVAEGYIDGKCVVITRKMYPLRAEKLQLEVDDEGMQLMADGSDFVPVRCTVVDINGVKKVLASEYVQFVVEGEGELIGDGNPLINPMKTQMGVATALVRSTRRAGTITIKAFSAGLKMGELTFESKIGSMPQLLDEEYDQQSRRVESGKVVIVNEKSESGADVEALQQRLKSLEQELVGKEQEIMELRSQQ